MEDHAITIALISEVFSSEDSLIASLQEAHEQGTELAILPELPLHSWSPATKIAKADDAEPSGGHREMMLRNAARKTRTGILGGVIRELPDGRRINLALLIDADGKIIGSSPKHVLPNEEGFWECDHYEPSHQPPEIIEFQGIRLGVQICSDANRPTAAQLLAAQGVQVILAPRATSPSSWDQWCLAYRAMALTASAWVVSVCRPDKEFAIEIGGPTLIVNPMGNIVLETTDKISTYALDLQEVTDARKAYPGYLDWPAETYIAGWNKVLQQKS